MDTEIILHIPHSSYFIPDEYKTLFYLQDKELFAEQLKMTDSYTDELFNPENTKRLVFPVSRLVCDVERFRDEKAEEMTKQGMWICYKKTSNLTGLKKVSQIHKTEILEKYYDPHHRNFERLVGQKLNAFGKCLIIDAHSFSSAPLPYELHAQKIRPDICIGTDSFHTPEEITKYFFNSFTNAGYKVGINNPFCGTIVPLKFYKENKNVISVMVEIKRSLYMDEKTGEKSSHFIKLKNDISKILKKIKTPQYI